VTRIVAVLATVALACGGCSVARSGTLGPAPTGAPPPSAIPGSPTATGTVTVQLWFVRDGKLVPTRRTRPATVATSRLTLTELTSGPSPVEAAAGLTTGLPAGTTFDIASIVGGVETVSFAPAFYAGNADAGRLRRAQVVYSLTQFPTVSRVAFRSGSEPVGGPVGRGDYADLLPPIVVTDPAIGQQVTSPVIVTGTADVFEATVSVRVLDSAGREIATAFTTATCGTGCRGDYRATVAYRLAESQAGTVEVYELSPRDGARVHVVAVPVALAAARG
jgi:Immunoglobulin-like domain of bacterial spore germination/Sporulation and spore germination